MTVDVKAYRGLHPEEVDEWERFVARADPPRKVQASSPWSAVREADFDPEAFVIRFRDGTALRACAWVIKRNVTVAAQEMPVAGVRGVLTDPTTDGAATAVPSWSRRTR